MGGGASPSLGHATVTSAFDMHGAPCSIHPPPDSSAARTGRQIRCILTPSGRRDEFQFIETSVSSLPVKAEV